MLQCQRMVGFKNNARRNTLLPGSPPLMAKLGRVSLALAGGALASLLLSGCATVGVQEQRLVSKLNMQFSKSSVFNYSSKILPQGLPVRVVSVNIEKDFPERTDQFVRRTGASFVVNDFAASFLKKFGSEGIPFLAIVDGSRSRPGAPRFEVVYKHSGFEGAEKMRHIIDGLGGTGAVGSRGRLKPDAVGPGRIATGGSTVHTIELNPEVIAASDILLSDTSIRYGQQFGGTQLDAAFTLTTFDEDYRPNPLPDALGFPEHLHEDRFSGLVNLRQRLVDQLTFLGTGGVYDGYPDYRRGLVGNRPPQEKAQPIILPQPPLHATDPHRPDESYRDTR